VNVRLPGIKFVVFLLNLVAVGLKFLILAFL